MSFLLKCPNCGERSVYEFRFGGETRARPDEGCSDGEWSRYLYARKNEAGVQQEWWFHRAGCRKWFQAVRDTVSNRVERSFWAGAGGESDPAETLPASEAEL
jgi:sarcosine oxidase subunit delta